jgi:hypothetical protein
VAKKKKFFNAAFWTRKKKAFVVLNNSWQTATHSYKTFYFIFYAAVSES